MKCPGYPFENCGSTSAGFFGYVQLDKPPLGTAGSSQASPAPSPTPSPNDNGGGNNQPVSTKFLGGTSSTSVTAEAPLLHTASKPIFGSLKFLSFLSSTSAFTTSTSSPYSYFPLSIIVPATTSILTSLLQNFPARVTVQQTVTSPPKTQVSLVSIVRHSPMSFFAFTGTRQ